MRELVIISGNGGTGKTSITAAFASLAPSAVLADCDVDAPDLHLLASPEVEQEHPFRGGRKARIEPGRCTGGGRCVGVCRFEAIRVAEAEDVAPGVCEVDPIACEGCSACVRVCPARAIRFEPVTSGAWFVSRTRLGPMAHARLEPGEDNSGKLVGVIRREARELARRTGRDLVLCDGSPGVGCPVIASLTGADRALVVAEPTRSGRHDALRVIELARQLGVPAALCVNRWDLSPEQTRQLERQAAAAGAELVGRVREDPAFVQAQLHQQTLVEFASADSPSRRDVRQLWQRFGG
ncbi:MAG: ATP-binding protein [Phycisphaeraceae bacterium]